MVSNYYTLHSLALDLDRRLRGSIIREIFCQSKNELQISIDSGGSYECLSVSCEPSRNSVFLRGEAHRARKNSVDVFRIVWGRIVKEVGIRPADREIIIQCSGELRLLIRMFGSKANVLLVDHHNSVIDSFLNAKEYRGTRIGDDEYAPRKDLPAAEDFEARLRAIGSVLVPAALKKLLPLFNSLLLRELCTRAGVREDRLVAELSADDFQRLFTASGSFLRDLEGEPNPGIYSHQRVPVCFSTVSLEHLKDAERESFGSVHDAIRVYVGKSHKQKTALQEKESLLHFLRQGVEKAERTLQKMEHETEALQRAMQYEAYGKLLMANLGELRKGMNEAILDDVFSRDRGHVTIRLDQKLTPAQNAEHYFNKAKHARAGVDEKIGHQDDVRKRWEILREFHDRVTDLQTSEQLADFATTHGEELKQLGFKGQGGGKKERNEEAPFRTFVVTGGFQVWVGKNSENNDLLTLKYAKPNDLWFHTRGSSGSHVVLRMGTGKGDPGKKAIEEAAGIAAFYSKMKTARHVPVAMTEKKYVHKPRGSPAGTVSIEREKLIFVNPALPPGDSHEPPE